MYACEVTAFPASWGLQTPKCNMVQHFVLAKQHQQWISDHHFNAMRTHVIRKADGTTESPKTVKKIFRRPGWTAQTVTEINFWLASELYATLMYVAVICQISSSEFWPWISTKIPARRTRWPATATPHGRHISGFFRVSDGGIGGCSAASPSQIYNRGVRHDLNLSILI